MASDDTFVLEKDRYGCITMNIKKTSVQSDSDFQTKLKASIGKWKDDGVRGVWIKVAKEHSSLIPICIEEGFDFHHAKPGYVMLKTWLPTDEDDMLPQYANQFLGCGGFVVNDKNQVLVIKEKYHSPSYRHWKLPGGHADEGEEIGDAAKREVMEETGIESEFEVILTFRHEHNYWHGCSDFYFVCLMRAKTDEIKQCNQEIAESCWMDIDDYMNMEGISASNRYAVQKYKEYTLSTSKGALKALSMLSYNKKYTHLVYSIHPTEDDDDGSIQFEDS